MRREDQHTMLKHAIHQFGIQKGIYLTDVSFHQLVTDEKDKINWLADGAIQTVACTTLK